LKNVKTSEIEDVPFDGVFVFIGHFPNTEEFKGQIELDENGYIIVDAHRKTNVEGVFAAGDVHDFTYRQAITAAGSGAIAALECTKFLAEKEGKAYPSDPGL